MKTTLLPQLQTFLVAARRKSFSAAARELGVSPAAVSQSVRQLEEQLRVVLFTRTTRTVALTDAGRRLLEGAGPGLGQALASLQEVSAQPGEAVGRLKLTVPEISVPYVVTPVLAAFRARHPRVEVEVVAENRLVDIVAEGYDAGVRLHEAIERDIACYAPWGNLAIFYRDFGYSNALVKLGRLDSGVEILSGGGPLRVTIERAER